MVKPVWWACFGLLATLSTAHAHSMKDATLWQSLVHMREQHSFMLAFVFLSVVALVAFVVYRLFLEPDYEKESRRRKRDGSGCGGSGCGSNDGGGSGCSGCGGD